MLAVSNPSQTSTMPCHGIQVSFYYYCSKPAVVIFEAELQSDDLVSDSFYVVHDNSDTDLSEFDNTISTEIWDVSEPEHMPVTVHPCDAPTCARAHARVHRCDVSKFCSLASSLPALRNRAKEVWTPTAKYMCIFVC